MELYVFRIDKLAGFFLKAIPIDVDRFCLKWSQFNVKQFAEDIIETARFLQLFKFTSGIGWFAPHPNDEFPVFSWMRNFNVLMSQLIASYFRFTWSYLGFVSEGLELFQKLPVFGDIWLPNLNSDCVCESMTIIRQSAVYLSKQIHWGYCIYFRKYMRHEKSSMKIIMGKF